MKSHVRTAIAFIAGILISGEEASSISDAHEEKRYHFSGQIEKKVIKLTDEEKKCSISGSGSNGNYVLYHFGERKFISLNIEKRTFNGLDHGSYTYFNGTVTNNKISFHDFGENEIYEFFLESVAR